MKWGIIQRLIVFFIIFFALFILSVVFYNRLYTTMMTNKVSELIQSSNVYSANDLLTRLNLDYEKVQRYIDEEDNLDNLNNQSLKVGSNDIIVFGNVYNNGYQINGVSYELSNTIDDSYVNNKVCFYDVESDFNILGTNSFTCDKLVCFNVSGKVAFVDALTYFDSLNTLIKDFGIGNEYFVIESNGRVNYTSFKNNSLQFYDILRHNEVKENIIEKFRTDIFDDFDNELYDNIKLDGRTYYLSFESVSKSLNENDIILVYLVEEKEALSNVFEFMFPLVILFCSYCIFLIVIVIIIYLFVIRKNKEIQLSLISYHANKKVIFRITKKGNVIYSNHYGKEEYPGLKSISEITPLDLNLSMTKIIENNLEFFGRNFNDLNPKYYRFFVLKVNFGYYIIGSDNTEYYHRYLQYRTYSFTNELTTLPNKNKLLVDLKPLIDSKKSCALLECKVLKFDNYYTLFNEAMTVEIIKHIAIVLASCIKDHNIELYHIKDDNFAMLFKDITDKSLPKKISEQIDETLIKPLEVDGNTLDIQTCYGCAYTDYDIKDFSAERFKANADIVLNKILNSSTERYGEYDLGLNKYITRERVMFEDLKESIEKKDFEMYLQPQFNNETNQIVGFESLIRWSNPKYKYQSPYIFIQLAEENNMINMIGQIVIEKTFELVKKLEKEDVTFALNVSPIQILQSGFVSNLMELVKKYEVNPSMIAIEITETFLMTNFELVIEKMNILKNSGFKLHLDDFGTGWSSLAYLKNLPFDTIKIDREFTRYISTDKATRTIVSKIISIAKGLDLNVICEGVEINEENEFLKRNGCNIIQGYLISRPVPFDEALKLLQDYKSGVLSVGKKKKNSKDKGGQQ